LTWLKDILGKIRADIPNLNVVGQAGINKQLELMRNHLDLVGINRFFLIDPILCSWRMAKGRNELEQFKPTINLSRFAALPVMFSQSPQQQKQHVHARHSEGREWPSL
jgi:hypothetical protein